MVRGSGARPPRGAVRRAPRHAERCPVWCGPVCAVAHRPWCLPRFGHRRWRPCSRGWPHGGHLTVPGGPTTVARPAARRHRHRDRPDRHRHRPRVSRPGHAGPRSALPAGRLDAGQIIDRRRGLGHRPRGARPGFVLFGTNRLVRILAAVRGRIPRRSATSCGPSMASPRMSSSRRARAAGRPGGRRARHRPVRCCRHPRAATGRGDARSARDAGSCARDAAGSRSRTPSTVPREMPSACVAGSGMTTQTSS